ncbi:MAG: serine hydrolase [Candidatus Marinimicrobia bacterium]|nr:serine hydrolase [Candidatus Neomarinimicrobiota bacterium]MCF7830028.1 serine hydrolase [Candidatus Neomarinimicrobiota bacterium]MCF7881930.1 serine hydrolase [Candidatus Neomarinimicrobiota bacterium]
MHKLKQIHSILILITITTLLASCTPKPSLQPEERKPKPAPVSVEAMLDSMTIEEKVGQLFMMDFRSDFYNEQSWTFKQISHWIEEYKVGGLIMFAGAPYEAARNVERFQAISENPLLVAADFEWGLPMRISAGTRFPENMAIAATGDPENAYRQGKITAREARTLGVNVSFSPVMDVNNNPDNPIINVRAYGEDPQQVAEYGVQYIKGLQENGVAATAKHFPGHGDTDMDSHLDLPVIDVNQARLDSLELVPFKAAIDSGVKGIMAAHIALPQITDGNAPATFSPTFLQSVLRDSLGFNGVVFSDALNMGGVTNNYWPGETAVRAVNAGVDMLLMSPDMALAYHTVLEAVQDGRITEDRLNQAVRRILTLKKETDVFEQTIPEQSEMEVELELPIDEVFADGLFQKAVTLVKDSVNTLPLNAGEIDSVVTLIVTDDLRYGWPGSTFLWSIKSRIDSAGAHYLGPDAADSTLIKIREAMKGADATIVGVFLRFADHKGTIRMPKRQQELLREIYREQKQVVTVGFGTPYLLRYFPEAPAYLVPYSTNSQAQRAVVSAIFGEKPIAGKLPITLPSGYEKGHGLSRDVSSNTWAEQQEPKRFEEVESLIQSAIADSVSPGMAVYIARNDTIRFAKGFGHFTYDSLSSAVSRKTTFDLASLTKVIATTPVAMEMYEDNYLHLDKPVSAYIPGFSGGLKDNVKIKHLLTHTSGLTPYLRFWELTDDPEQVMDMIINSELEYAPGDSTAYSDLGIILLGEILEKLGRAPLDELASRQIFRPLGMENTEFEPNRNIWDMIAPTEYDSTYRERMIQGEVHDRNTAFLGGVAGHAGLFSTIDDLGRYAQMLLSNGYYNGRKYFSSATIDTFTARQNIVHGSSRALGWDTPSRHGSLFGDYFSPKAYCHLGFTGTSIIVDPEYDIIVILLTNRVFPTRENRKIGDFRPKFHNAVMKALLSEQELEIERGR